MKILIFESVKIFFCLTLFITISCKKVVEEPIAPMPFISCCTHEVQVLQLGDSKYTIPNLVTANHDGINDVFAIFTNYAAFNDSIMSFKIYDTEGVLIFESANKSIMHNFHIWDGIMTEGPNKGDLFIGAFSYECLLRNSSGATGTMIGGACFVEDYCDVHEENIGGCVMPSQHYNSGEFDLELPNYESCD